MGWVEADMKPCACGHSVEEHEKDRIQNDLAGFTGDTSCAECECIAYDSEEDAARAYDRAATKHFGKFANRNFPKRKRKKTDDALI